MQLATGGVRQTYACTRQVRCWEIQPNGTSTPKAAHSHDQPVLCSAWNADGSSVFSGGCDKTVKLWNLVTNQQQVCVLATPRSLLGLPP